MGTPARAAPPELAERARALRDGSHEVAPTRDAATVALLRQGPQGPEVHLLVRHAGMVFGGMHVFPGGSVDAADAGEDAGAELDRAGPPALDWAGPPAAEFAAALGCDEPLARALVCAAVRETFEESGVLLAGPREVGGEVTVLDDVSTDEWEAERVALEAREQSLSQLLARRGLVLRADLLRPLAHWITPEVEQRRFDTRFFVAEVPVGQVCREVGGEASSRLWVRPGDALEQGLRILPPTEAVLRDLAGHADVRSALLAPRTIVPVLPRLVVRDDDSVVLLVPGDDGYDTS